MYAAAKLKLLFLKGLGDGMIYKKIHYLTFDLVIGSQKNHLNETVRNGSFGHPKHKFKLTNKKVQALCSHNINTNMLLLNMGGYVNHISFITLTT